MDLDRDSLELMLNLLDTDSRIKDALDNSGMNKRELEKNKQKARERQPISFIILFPPNPLPLTVKNRSKNT